MSARCIIDGPVKVKAVVDFDCLHNVQVGDRLDQAGDRGMLAEDPRGEGREANVGRIGRVR